MRVQALWRFASATVLAAVLSGVTAGAQATSQQRIPVRKESGGDVARRDSARIADSLANVARRDSIAMLQARNDSLLRAEQAYRDSVARVASALRDSIARADLARIEAARADSIARAEAAAREAAAAAAAAAAAVPAWMSRRGFYFGLGGGVSTPMDDYGRPYGTGWNMTVPFGWQKPTSRFGVRGDISLDNHGGETFSSTAGAAPPIFPPSSGFTSANFAVDDISIWSGNLDLTLDLFQWGANRLGAVYLIGGGGVHFVDGPSVNVTPTGGSAQPPFNLKGESQTEWGLNGGGGVSFGLGRAALFLESRYFTADLGQTNANWVPVIIGVKWF